MNYIVLDLEWNQAADMKTKLSHDLVFEIIEIGAVKLDEHMQQIDVFHELIKPQVFHKMHQITGELIHLKIEQLQNCRVFQEVATDFIDWCGEDCIFCTWGNLDLLELQKNMDYYKMTPLSEKPIQFYDVQKLFSIAFEDKKLRRTLEFATDYLQIEKDIAFHRADSDAYYTALVLQRMNTPDILMNYSFDTYRIPQSKKDEIHIRFADYEKYISRGFIDKMSAMEDREVVSTKCYLCRTSMKKKVRWFTTNGKHYYAIAHCEKHGFFKGKIRMRKTNTDHVYVVKTIKPVSEDVVEDILQKKEQAKAIRREKRQREHNKKREGK